MMKKKRSNGFLDFSLMFFILGVLACTSAQARVPAQAAAPAASVNVAGEWEITQENRLAGPLKWKIVFVQDSSKLKVTNIRPRGEDVVCEGKVDEDKIEWVMTRPTRQGGEIKYIYTGRIKDKNTLEGFCQLGNTERADWRAKRIAK